MGKSGVEMMKTTGSKMSKSETDGGIGNVQCDNATIK